MLAERPLLTTKKILAELKEPFQFLEPKKVITDFRAWDDLGGCGLTLAAERALLTIETILAKANQLS
jgi:hypothetical protein